MLSLATHAQAVAMGLLLVLHPVARAMPRALQDDAACPCDRCVHTEENTVVDCESFGLDCSCYAGCPCATCVHTKGNTVADCESFGIDCACYSDSSGGACADFDDRTAELNAECCDEADEDCSSGQPTTCNVGCAHVLLPYFDDCVGALGKDGATLFDDVVALCRAAEQVLRRHGGEHLAEPRISRQPSRFVLEGCSEDLRVALAILHTHI